MSSKEAAAYCGLCVQSFIAFAKRRNFRRIPGTYRYDRRALDKLLDSLYRLEEGGERGYNLEAQTAKVKSYADILRARKSRKEALKRQNN
jgi:hypothetical protein